MHSHVLVQILQIENAYIDQNAGNRAFIHVYEPLHENVVLSLRRATKAQASICICADSP